MNKSTPESNYVPGVCNINPMETAYRRKAGYAGIAIALVVLLPLVYYGASRYWRIVIILPLFLGVLGFVQAKNHFCVSYAAKGAQNANGNAMTGASPVGADEHTKDTRKATRMYLQAGAIAAILTVLCLLIPQR